MLQILIKSLSPAIAIVIGLYSYKYMDRFFRLLFWQVLFYLFLFSMSYVVTNYQIAHQMKENNQWLFNISLFFETILLTLALFKCLNKKSKILELTTLGLLMIFFLIQMALNGFYNYNKYGDIVECIFLTVLILNILYDLLNNSQHNNGSKPIIWALIGLLFYFACSIPYISLMDFLELNHPKLNTFLARLINGFLANIRYLCLAVSFYLIRRTPLNPSLNGNTE